MNGGTTTDPKLINILLVEDNPADVLLTTEALREGNIPHEINAVNDGLEAMDYLQEPEQPKTALLGLAEQVKIMLLILELVTHLHIQVGFKLQIKLI